ncbi:hypothetical protein E2562_029445 [Oryza meyeriana var. granulata]|uniref:Uncharacterized protein n=1 Tax=Oryza meyeriana var. granulata TaxID=110450 RepID=A0A6G1E4J6_9ORYZ|nr:hypothetical protein E2562_029445 [Oryza meyeriana var. granulata]
MGTAVLIHLGRRWHREAEPFSIEGTSGIPCTERNHKTPSPDSWASCKEASCCNSLCNMGGKLDTWKEKLSSNAFARKLLASPILVEALHFLHDERDPNSAFNWLERWTIGRVRRTISHPKRAAVTDAKPHTKKASYAMETESGKLKQNSRKSSAAPVEPPQTTMAVGTEKSRQNLRKFASSTADSVPDSQLTELEKVKRNLRKVLISPPDTSLPEASTEAASLSRSVKDDELKSS